MEKIKKLAYGVVATMMTAPATVFGAAPGGIEDGISRATEDTTLKDTDLADFLSDVLSWLLYFIGFLSVIAIVVSGIMYVTSAGDEGQVDKAKKTLIYAVVGLLVALLGLILVRTILQIGNE